jgi:hypothetical protein
MRLSQGVCPSCPPSRSFFATEALFKHVPPEMRHEGLLAPGLKRPARTLYAICRFRKLRRPFQITSLVTAFRRRADKPRLQRIGCQAMSEALGDNVRR